MNQGRKCCNFSKTNPFVCLVFRLNASNSEIPRNSEDYQNKPNNSTLFVTNLRSFWSNSSKKNSDSFVIERIPKMPRDLGFDVIQVPVTRPTRYGKPAGLPG